MALTKHGDGSVLRDEDVQKTAAAQDDQARQQREAALQQENEENDR